MNKYVLKINLDETLKWLVLDDQMQIVESKQFVDYASLPKLESDEMLVVLFAGEAVHVEQMKLPKTSRKNLLKAIPFMLEEKVVGGVENLHIVFNKIPKSDQHLVAAIERDKFAKIIKQITEQGLHPHAVLPDFIAWPSQAEGWSIHCIEDSVVVRTGLLSGFTVAKAYLPLALGRALASTSEQKPISCLVSDDSLMGYQEDFVGTLKFILQPKKNQLDPALFEEGTKINFLSGQFRLKKAATKRDVHWAYVRYAFVAWLFILFGGKFVEWGVYHHQRAEVRAAISAVIDDVLPSAASSEDPKALIQAEIRRLEAEKKNDPFIDILTDVGKVLNQFPEAQLKTLNFSDTLLTIKLQATKLSVLESFSRVLEQHHLVIKKNEVSSGVKNVIAEIKVGRA